MFHHRPNQPSTKWKIFEISYPDLNTGTSGSTQPVTVGAEAESIDGVTTVKGVQMLGLIQVPQHGLAILEGRKSFNIFKKRSPPVLRTEGVAALSGSLFFFSAVKQIKASLMCFAELAFSDTSVTSVHQFDHLDSHIHLCHFPKALIFFIN